MSDQRLRQRCLFLFVVVAGMLSASGTGDGIRFDEVGKESGVRAMHRTRRFAGKHADVLRMFTSGGAAAAVTDYNNDGFDDIFVLDSDAGRPSSPFSQRW